MEIVVQHIEKWQQESLPVLGFQLSRFYESYVKTFETSGLGVNTSSLSKIRDIAFLKEALSKRFISQHVEDVYEQFTIFLMENRGKEYRMSRHQSVEEYIILNAFRKRIETAAKEFGYNVNEYVRFSSRFSCGLNAFAVRHPSLRDRFVMFESTLIEMAMEISKGLIASMPIHHDLFSGKPFLNLQLQHFEKHAEDGIFDLLSFFNSFVGDGMPHVHAIADSSWEYASKEEQYFVSLLRKQIILFIIGHEYAHICKHQKNYTTSSFSFSNGETTEILSLAHEKEFEADILGLNLLIQASKSETSSAFALMSAVSLFMYLYTFEQLLANEGWKPKEEYFANHPSPLKRIENITNYYFNEYDTDSSTKEWAKNYVLYTVKIFENLLENHSHMIRGRIYHNYITAKLFNGAIPYWDSLYSRIDPKQ